MKYCTKCGNQLDDDAKFCTKCGTRFSNVSAQAAQSAENNPQTAVQPETLGQQEPQPESVNDNQNENPNGKKRGKLSKGALIGIVCGIAAVVLCCIFLLPGASESIETTSLQRYFLYDNGNMMAYVKDGNVTEFEAPTGTVELNSLFEYSQDNCLTLNADNELYIVDPQGNAELFIDNIYGGSEINVNRFGVIYQVDEYEFEFKRFNGDIQQLGSPLYVSLIPISPDGMHMCAGITGSILRICVFNNGSVVSISKIEDGEKIAINYSKDGDTKELYVTGKEAFTAPKIYYNKEGSEALIVMDYLIYTVNDEGNFNLIDKLNPNYSEILGVYPNSLSGFIYGNMVYSYGFQTTEENFDNLYYYKFNSNDSTFGDIFEIYYYSDGNSDSILLTQLANIVQNQITYIDTTYHYTTEDGVHSATLSGSEFKNIKKLSNHIGNFFFNSSGTNGYIYNGRELFYTVNGVSKDALTSDTLTLGIIDSSGQYYWGSDYENGKSYLFNKEKRIADYENIDILSPTRRAVEFDELYIQNDYLLYLKEDGHLYNWTPNAGETLLLKDVIDYT